MNNLNNRAYIYEFNNLTNQCNSIFHSAAQRAGISDCALSIYFTLFGAERQYTQSDICDCLCLRRQTVNSALKKMKADGYITLTHAEDKSGKYIVLTDKGSEFIKSRIMPMVQVEEAVCNRLSDDEKNNFLNTYRYIIQCLKDESEKIRVKT